MTKYSETMQRDVGVTTGGNLYDKDYFDKHCGTIPYNWDVSHWPKFFCEIAAELNRSIKPRTVLDVGCAIGFLVDAFWRRGVRAYGIDLSAYAISQVPSNLQPFCRVLSATEPLPEEFPDSYDLITCIEVLEHIPPQDTRAAIENMATRTSCILFSSTPHDFTEPTHVNVRPVIYWMQRFAEVGFYPDLRFDASFVSPQAFLLRKQKPVLEEDAIPFFAESINKKFQLKTQQEEITALTGANEELQRDLRDYTARLDREIEQHNKQTALLHQTQQDLRDVLDDRQSLRGKVERLEYELLSLRSIVENLRELAREHEMQIKQIDAERSQLREVVAEKHSILEEIREESARRILDYEQRIEFFSVVQSGILWDLFVLCRKTKDRCFPPGTRRRAWYDWGLAKLKAKKGRVRVPSMLALVARHPIRALRNLNKVNVEKFFYHLRNSDPAVTEAKLERKLGVDQRSVQPLATEIRKFALIVSGCPGDAFRYRCEHQAEQLRFLGLTVDIAYFDQVDCRSALDQYQFLWLHRVPHTQAVEDFVRSAHTMGKPVVFDTDDLIFDEEKVPYIRALQWMSQDEVNLYYDGVRRYHRTLALCEFVTVTTEPLCEAVQRLFPDVRCFVNANALSDAQLAHAEAASKLVRSLQDNNIVRIGYFSGTRTHNVDFQECSRALERILDTFPNVRLMIVGHLDLSSEFERFGEQLERYPLLPWQELPALFRSVDINLAPLELENPFTEAKSALKYFEAAALGVPTVASDVGPFQRAVIPGENGFLCRNENDWVQSLTQLVQDENLRHSIGQRARSDVLKNFTTRKQAPHLKSVLKQILQQSPVGSKKQLSIAFVLRAPIAHVGGGYKVIFLLAHDLARRGHDVHLYVEPVAHLEGKNEAEIVEFCRTHFGESTAQIHVGHNSIRSNDVAIATNWPTAFVVDSLSNTRCKLYLIQDYEPDFYEPDDLLRKEVEKTYDLPLKKVAIGRYLACLFRDRDKLHVEHFDFALDHDIFSPLGRKPSISTRVLFFARPALKRRGYGLGIEALEKVYKVFPNVSISLYGMEDKPKLPFPYTHLGVLDQRKVSEAMRDADIHLSFSFSNISQVPFQAMACGCAVVEAKLPSVMAMVDDGKNCLLAEPDSNSVADVLALLVRNENLRRDIAQSGIRFVANKTWVNSCEQFERIVLASLMIPEPDPEAHDSDLKASLSLNDKFFPTLPERK